MAACGGGAHRTSAGSGVGAGAINGGSSGTNGNASSGVAGGSTTGTMSGGSGTVGGSGASGAASSGDAGDAGADVTGTSGDLDGSSDVSVIAPSCAPGGPGMTNCGADAETCCTSLEVTGGTFYRTYGPLYSVDGSVGTPEDGGAAGQADPATVSTFRLDKYLVTVGRFRQFFRAWSAGWLPAAWSGKHTHLNNGKGLSTVGGFYERYASDYELGWVPDDNGQIALTNPAHRYCESSSKTWTDAPGAQENLPINCVSWWEALAFCIWDGGFLPTEAEWEYAAAGGDQQRDYPWGSTAPGTANRYAIYGCYYPSGSGTCSGVSNVAPVGTAALGVGRWGQLDLAGEVGQWNLDSPAKYANPCVDCTDFTSGARVFTGGIFWSTAQYSLYPSYRGGDSPGISNDNVGVRCARTP
jgi:sulfatase modifying factor 1